MKHTGIKLSIVLTTALLGSSAYARKAAPPADDEPSFRQKILGAYDTDKDGRLGDPELAAMKQARTQGKATRKAAMLQKYDVNRNGTIDETEKARRKADHLAHLLPQFDANHNGVINPAERKAVADRRAKVVQAHRWVMTVLRFDANRDNKLQITELPGKGGKQQQRFRAMDKNRDGAIERSEFRVRAGKHGKQHAKVGKAKNAKQAKQAKRSV